MDDLRASLQRIEAKLDKIGENYTDLQSRVSVIESRNGGGYATLEEAFHQADKRLTVLEVRDLSNRSTWERWADLAFKIIGTVAAAFILIKTGIKP